MGSLCIVLPARLRYARQVARQRLLPQTDPTDAEVTEITPRAAAEAAPVVSLRFEPRFLLLLDY